MPLGTDAEYPGAGVDAVAVACDVPAMRGGSVRLAAASMVSNKLSGRTVQTLQSKIPYKAGDKTGAAPLLDFDVTGKPTLDFSQQLKENIEWADDVSQPIVDALNECVHAFESHTSGLTRRRATKTPASSCRSAAETSSYSTQSGGSTAATHST